jgi:hypothetical protein
MLQSLKFSNKKEREIVEKKRSVLASLDSESRIAMHLFFLKVSRVALKAYSSILLVYILTLKSNLGCSLLEIQEKETIIQK